MAMEGELIDRVQAVAVEVGGMEEKLAMHQKGLGLQPGQTVMTIDEATSKTEDELPRQMWKQLMEYWAINEQVKLKKELLEAMKLELKALSSIALAGEGRGRGGGDAGAPWLKKLDSKAVAHLKDAKFGGKNGGGGWANFFEDFMVAIGSIDKDLENEIKDVTDLRNKALTDPESVKMEVDVEIWNKYSGELFARLMEITKDNALNVVMNEGVRSARCGFWTIRKLMERYNPRSYTSLLRLLLSAVNPGEVKDMKDVQTAIEDWENQMTRLEDEYGETINEKIKVAILVSMIPEVLKEKVFELEKNTTEIEYSSAKDAVLAFAMRRAERKRPKEDEIMAMERQRLEEEGDDWARMLDAREAEEWTYGERVDLDAVRAGKGDPMMTCLRCGGIGHMAKECGSPWDMFGKGGKGGKGKGGYKGGKGPSFGGYGGKGGGKESKGFGGGWGSGGAKGKGKGY